MSLAASTRLGHYEILSTLGRGGMGEVYRARDTRLRREVAIKVLPEGFAQDPDRLARFQREAEVLATLSHPNIGAVYGLEKANGLIGLVLELVQGETLADLIARGPLAVSDALRIAQQIADALDAAHEKGVTHRDLKPANIMIAADGKVKVLDFGLAKQAFPHGGTAGDAALTMSPTMMSPAMMTSAGVILGTAAYMAPEQARGKTVDTRVDIWAFGCVLFEMLTGKRPFDGETVTDILAAIVMNEPEWRALPPDTPPIVRSLLRRCLQKDPAERLRHAGDARLEIREAVTEPGASWQATPPPPQRTQRAMIIPWALATTLAVALGLLAIQTQWRRAAQRTRTTMRLELDLPSGMELYRGFAQSVALSPDGTRVAFIGVLNGVRSLYVRSLDQFEAVAVKGTETITACFFSPDGLAMGFLSADGILKRVSLADGLIVPLSRDVYGNGGSGTWGIDDRLTFTRAGTLWQVAASGGAPQQLMKLADQKHELLQVSPAVVAGGRAILFTSVTGSNRGAAHIEALSLATGERHVVVDSATFPQYASSGHLIFFRHGALLAAPFDLERLEVTGPPVRVVADVPVDRTGTPLAAVSSAGALVYPSSGAASQLVWVSRQGVEQSITDTPRLYTTPRLAPDGHRLLVQVNGDLWIHDTARASFTRVTSDQTVGTSFPVWTPDGTRVVFRAGAGLRWIDTDGSGRSEDIPDTVAADYPSSVSPDGGTLAFTRITADSSADVELLSLRGEPRPRPLVNTSAYEGGAQFSPDGRWMAYASDESGQMEIYVRPFPGPDRKWSVSTQGGRAVLWSRNGKELFYRNGNKTMAVSVSTGPEPTFSAPRLLFEQRYAFGSSVTVANFDISADGERFVMVKDESGSGRLNVVLNWFDELTRLAPPKH